MYRIIEQILQIICALALLVMMSVGAIDIILGELFNMYLPFKVELSGLLFAVVIFLSQPLVAARKEHVVVDIFSSKLKSHWKLVSRVIVKGAALTVFTLFAIASWHSFVSSWDIKEQSLDYLEIPIYPIKFAVFFGFTLSALIIIKQLFALFSESRKARDEHGLKE